MKLRNLVLALKDQLPWRRLFKNLRAGHTFGLFHQNSHRRADTGKPKVAYGSKATAVRAAESLHRKRGVYFSNYKCVYCDGWHIGRNRDNK